MGGSTDPGHRRSPLRFLVPSFEAAVTVGGGVMSRRSLLRARVFELARDRCEWPRCTRPAEELAHIKSIGMGGGKHADTIDNTFAACRHHARISDGLYPVGGRVEYLTELRTLGVRSGQIRAVDVHDALRRHLRSVRAPRIKGDPSPGGRGYLALAAGDEATVIALPAGFRVVVPGLMTTEFAEAILEIARIDQGTA